MEIYLLGEVLAYHNSCAEDARRQMDYALQAVARRGPDFFREGDTQVASGFPQLLETYVPGTEDVLAQVLIGYLWHEPQARLPELGIHYVTRYEPSSPTAGDDRLQACNAAMIDLDSQF